jgi:hypothetical protein
MADYSNSPYYSAAISAADQYGVPENIFVQLIGSESSFNPNPGPNGSPYAFGNPAYGGGIAQFIPSTAQSMGVNRLDPVSSLNGAASYLSSLFNRFGSWTAAVLSYKGASDPVNQSLFGTSGTGLLNADLQNALANPSTVANNGASNVAGTAGTGGTAGAGAGGTASAGLVPWLSKVGQWIAGLAGRAGLILVAMILLILAVVLFGKSARAG